MDETPSSDIYELQLVQLQEQLVTTMIENQTLSKLDSLEYSVYFTFSLPAYQWKSWYVCVKGLKKSKYFIHFSNIRNCMLSRHAEVW